MKTVSVSQPTERQTCDLRSYITIFWGFFATSLLSHSLCLVDMVEQAAWGKVKTMLWPWEYSHSKGALMKENESENEGQAWSNESR